MARQEPLRIALVGRLLAEMARRGVTAEQVAKRAGYDPRTGTRVANGETCSLETLERFESAMRADLLACPCPDNDRNRSEPLTNEHRPGPVIGWKAAAEILQVPVATLRRHRRSLGDRRKRPWWADEAALRFWYTQLVSGCTP